MPPPDVRKAYEALGAAIKKLSRHFGIPEPNYRIGCEGCPFYDPSTGECRLGYIACYNPATKTITIRKPEYAFSENVVLHELLHHVAELYKGTSSIPRGYMLGVTYGSSEEKIPPAALAFIVLGFTAIALDALVLGAIGAGRRRLGRKKPIV